MDRLSIQRVCTKNNAERKGILRIIKTRKLEYLGPGSKNDFENWVTRKRLKPFSDPKQIEKKLQLYYFYV